MAFSTPSAALVVVVEDRSGTLVESEVNLIKMKTKIVQILLISSQPQRITLKDFYRLVIDFEARGSQLPKWVYESRIILDSSQNSDRFSILF